MDLFNQIRKKLVIFVHFKGFIISQKPKSSPLSYFAQDRFKFGTKLISDNFYVSVREWFLFLYFKYWYFRSLKRFWDCDFNFANVLELHHSMENDKWYNKKSFDLAFHFSFNQNKLWTNRRSNRALLYNKPSLLHQWK